MTSNKVDIVLDHKGFMRDRTTGNLITIPGRRNLSSWGKKKYARFYELRELKFSDDVAYFIVEKHKGDILSALNWDEEQFNRYKELTAEGFKPIEAVEIVTTCDGFPAVWRAIKKAAEAAASEIISE